MEILVVSVIVAAAAAAILMPLFRQVDSEEDLSLFDPADRAGKPAQRADPQTVEREVQRYRKALRQGTVCARCGQANPDASLFCYECGRRLRTTAVAPKKRPRQLAL